MGMASIYGGAVLADLYLAQMAPMADTLAQRARSTAQSAAKSGRAYDARPLAAVVSDLKTAGQNAWPMISPSNFVEYNPGKSQPGVEINRQTILPMGSLSRVENVYCNEGGQWLVYGSDRYGFQNPDSLWSQGSAQVALLGDSFAQGACVPVDNNIAAHLRTGYGPVVNLGIGGSGQLLQYAAAREYLPLLKPRHVIWLFFEGNDLTLNLPVETQHPILRKYLDDGKFTQNLRQIQPEIDAALKAFATDMQEQHKATVTKPRQRLPLSTSLRQVTLRDRLGLTSCPSKNQDFATLSRIFRAGRELVESWGGTLTVVYLPYWGNNCDMFDGNPDHNWIHGGVIKAIADAGVNDVIDLMPLFTGSPRIGDYFQYPGSHYNEAGYRRVADEIITHLKAAGAPRP